MDFWQVNAIKTAIYGKLTAGTALTALLAGTTSIYDVVAPQGASFPYVVFNQQAASSDTDDANDRGSWFYQIQAVGTTNLKTTWAIATQVDALMQPGAALSVTGYNNLWQRRTEWIEYTETDTAGQRYYHAGAIYQLWLTKP